MAQKNKKTDRAERKEGGKNTTLRSKICRKSVLLPSVFGCLAVILWVFCVYDWPQLYRIEDPYKVSYDGRITFNLTHSHLPETEAEIVQIVRDANNQGRKIRVLASGHSWSEIAQTQDIMISLGRYKGKVSFDPATMEYTVKAGTRLAELNELLDKDHVAMINLGSVTGQTIAGAISTATHGTGHGFTNLAALVTKLKFVSGSGEVMTVDNSDERFRALQPEYRLSEVRSGHTLDECINELDTLSKGERVKYWVDFHNNVCNVFNTSKTTEEPFGFMCSVVSNIIYYAFAVVTRITYLVPSLTTPLMKLVSLTLMTPTHRVAKSYEILTDFFRLPIHQESEVVVELKDTAELIRTIRDVVINGHFPVNYVTEVRFVKGDDAWLSPHYGSDKIFCAVTLTIYAPEKTSSAYFDAVYTNATRKFNGRVHWGKYFTSGPTEIRAMLPRFDDFADVRLKLDPNGVFMNDALKKAFGF
ncbi:hypothetical protein EMCRGX_G015492 [Ephydatia muelleri]